MVSNTTGGRMMDPQKFEAFMQNYQNMVFTTAARLLANDTEAEDVAQEVFLRAFDHFDELEHSPTAGGWLKTVARNLCLNHLSRYRARWRFFSEMQHEGNEGESDIEFPAPERHEQEVNRTEQRAVIDDVMKQLPAAQRVPLVLFHFESLGYEEIASRLGISLSKVKTDIFRGREALRKKLRWRLELEEQNQPA
jgi:RNA polymerase sigma-70 factor (ECF subfamily)